MEMQKILKYCVEQNASDVHILAGVPPTLRLYGELMPIPEAKPITPERSQEMLFSVMNEDQRSILETDKEIDFSYSIPSGHRFRVNVYYEKGVLAGAFRAIPSEIRSIEELGLPSVLHKFTKRKQGLVLVTGPAGHGKSTTLAAMIEEINQNRSEHIVTIEDPIEFVYEPKESIISQREMHADTHSWSVALRSTLREDPDVVLIGEMRDKETIASVLTIAETGHLVFATLHTNNAAQTIDRIVDAFPEEQQSQIKSQLALSLEAVLSERLVPSLDDKLTPVMEILIATSAVRSNIREGKTHLLQNVIQTSGEMGMKTLDMALAEAYQNDEISLEVGRSYADNLDDFNRLVSRGG